MTTVAVRPRERLRLRIRGTVQGVGFRPFVYRLARELGLAGFVLNDAHGVVAEVEGDAATVARFVARLQADAPPLAQIESVASEPQAPTGEAGFRIVESPSAGRPDAAVTPDTSTCDDCLRELFDPSDRRYRYPFINCTNCGPRFTIVRGIPYDRPNTTMATFAMCPACRAEYDDPENRRFHAQPNACPECGPHARMADAPCVDPSAAPPGGSPADPLAAAARAIRDGQIVAIKGLGGFHLACAAGDDRAVGRLRARKHREDKPFALMVGDLEMARSIVELSAAEEQLLLSRERPVVLAPRRSTAEARIADAVAPRSRDLGVMLPYSPLHHLLVADAGVPLVMTSGNVSDEPIAYRDADALERLAGIADLFLLHDRPIETRTDDSVVRAFGNRPLFARRSRGYVPAALELPVAARRPILATGAEQKNTFCLARDEHAWVGHHIGDLENWETLRSFADGIAHFERLFAIKPELVAHDLHPDYLSTKHALELDGVELTGVQHHHAHLAACLAEHGESGPAIGAIYDGTGYGSDGTIWGGEILCGDLRSFARAGHLLGVPMPGGAAAIREPWRMACAWLAAAFPDEQTKPGRLLTAHVDAGDWKRVKQVVRGGPLSPQTSSAGRLFDALAALCGIAPRVNYEGQAAIELEAVADPGERGSYPFELEPAAPRVASIDPRGAIRLAVADIERGCDVASVAARFHNGFADVTAAACIGAAEANDIDLVVLSGGVFQNVLLLRRCHSALTHADLRVLIPERLPPGDGGISFGQAAIAAAIDAGEADVRHR